MAKKKQKKQIARVVIKRPAAAVEVKETELEEVTRRLGWTEEIAGLQARFVRGVMNQR